MVNSTWVCVGVRARDATRTCICAHRDACRRMCVSERMHACRAGCGKGWPSESVAFAESVFEIRAIGLVRLRDSCARHHRTESGQLTVCPSEVSIAD